MGLSSAKVHAFARVSRGAVVAAWLALGCAGGDARGGNTPASTDPNPGEIKHMIASLNLGEPDAERRFSAEMREHMSPLEFRSTWRNMLARYGVLTAFDVTGVDHGYGKQRYTVKLAFKRCTLDALVVFEPNSGEIIGLFFSSPHASALAMREAAAVNPPEPDLEETTLTVGAAPAPLGAALTVPSARGNARLPAVLLVSGSGPNDRDETLQRAKPFRDIAHELARRNIVTLRFDKRTFTYPAGFMNGQKTVEEEVLADAVTAMAVLRARPEVDPKRVYVLGHSLGAWLAPEIAARSGNVAGLILVAGPGRPFPAGLLDQLHLAGEKAEALAPLERQINALPTLPPDEIVAGMRAAYWQDLNRRDEMGTARKLGVRVVYLRGANDRNVFAVDQENWARAFAGDAQFRAETLPGLNHLLLPTGADLASDVHVPADAIDKIAEFVLDAPPTTPATTHTP